MILLLVHMIDGKRPSLAGRLQIAHPLCSTSAINYAQLLWLYQYY